jgi:protein TonB
MSAVRGAIGGDLWTAVAPRRGGLGTPLALSLAIAVHGLIAAGLAVVGPARLARQEPVVEMEVQERRPPPPELRPPVPPPPAPEPPPPPRPRIVPRRLAAVVPRLPVPVATTPPPPNQQPPKAAPEAPPVFGVSISSVVAGDSAAMAVPVGNTLMTKERTAAKPGATPKPSGVEGLHPFVPVADIYVSSQPKVLREVGSADIYPPDARRMGLEGKVILKVSLDESGDVVLVKVIGKAGHGFDEAARDALRQFKFSPARTSDGRAVAYNITYTYRFTLDSGH